MSFTIQHLIEDQTPPVCVSATDTLQQAVDLMIENDYSQLPVLEEGRVPLGMVTTESVLRAVRNFGLSLEQLHVKDAIVDVARYQAENDLFELLNELRDSYVVLIVNANKAITGILTSYDAMEFFRQRSEDMLWVQDIESALKDHIRAEFGDEKALAAAIEETTNEYRKARKHIQPVLNEYLKLAGHAPDAKLMEQALGNVSRRTTGQTKDLDRLTLSEYTTLLFHGQRWPAYSANFGLDIKALSKLLNSVRESRNVLAHFRGELTPLQRDELRFCVEWFAHHRVPEPKDPVTIVEPQTPATPPPAEIIPVEETPQPEDSRYAPLAAWLQSQPTTEERMRLTFDWIEQLISGRLPESARRHRSWWANDSVGHTQSQQWLEAGWCTTTINLSRGEVVFARVHDRAKKYIEFFTALQKEFGAQAVFPIKETNPSGATWMAVLGLPENRPQHAVLSFSFTHRRSFRVELYIDTGEKESTKRVFYALQDQKETIEAQLGAALTWENIENKRASRIALYYPTPITITMPATDLKKLREWAIVNMNNLYRAIAAPANQHLLAVTVEP